MENQVPDNYFYILARERSHEEARQTVTVNRMLIQSLVLVNGGAAITVLALYGARRIANAIQNARPKSRVQAAESVDRRVSIVVATHGRQP